ncbi:MAG TPA: Crp/Fnr family transcriptional regulator [Roseateles sp.]|uniref:Crp/Fnr family transcriptional regulator n=1 Tax=Roseateles sp. TaxID=1971397 RepID=UPI002ED9C988
MLDMRAYLEATPLGARLTPPELQELQARAVERSFARGAHLVAVGAVPTHWIGIIDGLVSLSVTHADGDQTMLDAVGDGGWFGEGTLLKGLAWQFDAVALRKTRAVLIPVAQFRRLRDTSLGFNHFLQDLLNARLGALIGTAICARHAPLEARVARAVSDLAQRAPSGEALLRLSQAEVALLAGTSRQRANVALKRLAAQGLVDVVRGGIRVRDIKRLSALSAAEAPA